MRCDPLSPRRTAFADDMLPFSRSRIFVQAVLLSSYSSNASSEAPLLHGRYPASSLLWASPTPGQGRPSVMYSLGPSGFGYPFPALPGLPGSSTDLFLRAVPNHPGRSGECLLIASPPISGFIILGRLATSTLRHEAESGSLALRLAGLLPRFPPAGLLRLAPVPLHARTSNLHGEFLSIHKISQA